MAIVEREIQSLFADKAALRRLMAEQNEKMGIATIRRRLPGRGGNDAARLAYGPKTT